MEHTLSGSWAKYNKSPATKQTVETGWAEIIVFLRYVAKGHLIKNVLNIVRK